MRDLRRAMRLSQADLAKALDMSVRQIQYYEAGHEIPHVVNLACKQLVTDAQTQKDQGH